MSHTSKAMTALQACIGPAGASGKVHIYDKANKDQIPLALCALTTAVYPYTHSYVVDHEKGCRHCWKGALRLLKKSAGDVTAADIGVEAIIRDQGI